MRSKYIAMTLFILLPFLSFWLGMQYQKHKTLPARTTLLQPTTMFTPTLSLPKKRDDAPPESWQTYSDGTSFSINYPGAWHIRHDPNVTQDNEQPALLLYANTLDDAHGNGLATPFPSRYIGISSVVSAQSPHDYIQSMIQKWASPPLSLDIEADLHQRKIVFLNGSPAILYDEPGLGGRANVLLISSGKALFFITSSGTQTGSSQLSDDPIITSILSSFSFTLIQQPFITLSDERDLIAEDTGKTFTYAIGTTFTVILDKELFPLNGLSYCQDGIIREIPTTTSVAQYFSARTFTVEKNGSCRIQNGSYAITIHTTEPFVSAGIESNQKTFTDPDYYYSFTYPDTWVVDQSNEQSQTLDRSINIFSTTESNKPPEVIGQLYVWKPIIAGKQIGIQSFLKDFPSESTKQTTISRYKGYRTDQVKQEQTTISVLFEKDNRVFQLAFVISNGQQKKMNTSAVEALISSFR